MSTPGVEFGTAADESVLNGNNPTNGAAQLTDAEKQLLREELKKTEDEINTLRSVLSARQRHAAELKRKLGLSPLAEVAADLEKTLKGVTETGAYQKTSEVVSGTADAVKSKLADVRNSSLFKSFETKIGTAYTTAKLAASTSIDHLSSAAAGRSGANSQATTPATEAPNVTLG